MLNIRKYGYSHELLEKRSTELHFLSHFPIIAQSSPGFYGYKNRRERIINCISKIWFGILFLSHNIFKRLLSRLRIRCRWQSHVSPSTSGIVFIYRSLSGVRFCTIFKFNFLNIILFKKAPFIFKGIFRKSLEI